MELMSFSQRRIRFQIIGKYYEKKLVLGMFINYETLANGNVI